MLKGFFGRVVGDENAGVAARVGCHIGNPPLTFQGVRKRMNLGGTCRRVCCFGEALAAHPQAASINSALPHVRELSQHVLGDNDS